MILHRLKEDRLLLKLRAHRCVALAVVLFLLLKILRQHQLSLGDGEDVVCLFVLVRGGRGVFARLEAQHALSEFTREQAGEVVQNLIIARTRDAPTLLPNRLWVIGKLLDDLRERLPCFERIISLLSARLRLAFMLLYRDHNPRRVDLLEHQAQLFVSRLSILLLDTFTELLSDHLHFKQELWYFCKQAFTELPE